METEKVAILVDGGFYQRRAKSLWGDRTAKERADELESYCRNLLRFKANGKNEHDSLYRIFYYDCPPADNTVYYPPQKKNIYLKKSNLYLFMTAFLKEMRSKRKVALRLGRLSKNDLYYTISREAQKELLLGERTIQELTEADFRLNITQKGVDMRIAVDISSMAFKHQVTRIILISGDSDFVPAAKLARREGIDFILDPMGASISEDLAEHIDGIKSVWKHDPLKIVKQKGTSTETTAEVPQENVKAVE